MGLVDFKNKFFVFIKNGINEFWKFFVGGIIVVVGFFGNFFDFKQPSISLEITEIQQRTASEVDVKSSPAFANYRALMSGDMGFRYSYSLADGNPFKGLQQSIDRRAQEIADTSSSIDRLRSRAEKIPGDFKSSLTPDERRQRASMSLVATDLDDIVRYGDRTIDGLEATEAKKIVESFQAALDTKRSLIKLAQGEIEAFRAKSEKTEAKIVVTAAISNSGDGATTLKPQALLRADLGQGNYLDINLKISNTDKSEVKPRGASIVRFESDSISQLAPADQERFLSFFRNTSPTNLFIVDVRGNYYRSNTIPFAQGIYEQRIFDGIKNFATSQINKR